ncbi:DUF1846 family protein, partial [Corynebacterium diphtheriae]
MLDRIKDETEILVCFNAKDLERNKLFDDLHASRVLPGFTPDNKIAMLDRIKDETEILVCFNAKDLERNK